MGEVLEFNFEDIKRKPAHFIQEKVVSQGAVLVKNVPNLDNAHKVISPVGIYPTGGETWAHLKGFPGTVEVSNSKGAGWFGKGELGWHTNGIYLTRPETCISLFCDTPPLEGGETLIINNRQAFESLDERTKSYLSDFRVTYARNKNKNNRLFYSWSQFEMDEIKKHDRRNHPDIDVRPCKDKITRKLIMPHPVDGKEGFYFPFLHATEIRNDRFLLEEDELVKLKEMVLRKAFISTIFWEKGDLLLVDQIHTLHKRLKFSGARRLYRIAHWWKREPYRKKFDSHVALDEPPP